MKTISRYIMTLALLLTAVTGAWATDPNAVTAAEINSDLYSGWKSIDGKLFKASELPGFQAVTEDQAKSWAGVPSTGHVILYYEFVADGNVKAVRFENGVYVSSFEEDELERYLIYEDIAYMGETRYFYTTGPAPTEPDVDVKWDAATKTGTFVMPAFDVEIAPIYAKAAAFATTGTEPEVKTLLPTAIEGIFAGTTDAIVKAGTVAMMGKTENPQGIVMYAVTSINQATAPELSAFSADVPTAENIADEGADVLVWYYIQGANTPDGQEATAENTFNDSEICETPIKVTVLPNKYDIQFNAANAYTIEAGKATVTVGGTAATVTEGKLEGVKMGSEVKVKANTGYKFRKVEVKKKGAVLTITVAKGTTDLSGDKLLYYTPGETYRQAIANHPENKLDGGLGWNIWDGGNDATIFYKESTDKSRDLSIDGDQHFRPTDSINLDTVIDPTLNFYFVTQF